MIQFIWFCYLCALDYFHFNMYASLWFYFLLLRILFVRVSFLCVYPYESSAFLPNYVFACLYTCVCVHVFFSRLLFVLVVCLRVYLFVLLYVCMSFFIVYSSCLLCVYMFAWLFYRVCIFWCVIVSLYAYSCACLCVCVNFSLFHLFDNHIQFLGLIFLPASLNTCSLFRIIVQYRCYT